MFLKRSYTFKILGTSALTTGTCLIENLTHYKQRGFLTYNPLKNEHIII